MATNTKHIPELTEWESKQIPEGWEFFRKVVFGDTVSLKVRKQYEPNDIRFNDDGYEYKEVFIPINAESKSKIEAAAPELLEALQAMIEAHSHIGGIGRDRKKSAHDKALAAIKKATE